MSIPAELKYTKEHEWIRIEGDVVAVGITDFAQDWLGDIVYVEQPGLGTEVSQGDVVAEIESVKAVSDIYAPVSGRIIEVNVNIEGNEEAINQDPYGKGWLFKIQLKNEDELDDLLEPDAYNTHVEAQEK